MKKRQRKKNFKKWLMSQTFGSGVQLPYPIYEIKDEIEPRIVATYPYISIENPPRIILTVTA